MATTNNGRDWNVLARYFSIPRSKSAAQKKLDATLRARRARSAGAMRKAKALAEKHGIEIEREDVGAYWVTHPQFSDADNDPLEGSHFCSDGAEVLQAVEVYVAHLSAAAK